MVGLLLSHADNALGRVWNDGVVLLQNLWGRDRPFEGSRGGGNLCGGPCWGITFRHSERAPPRPGRDDHPRKPNHYTALWNPLRPALNPRYKCPDFPINQTPCPSLPPKKGSRKAVR